MLRFVLPTLVLVCAAATGCFPHRADASGRVAARQVWVDLLGADR
jgi:hypothetical protein